MTAALDAARKPLLGIDVTRSQPHVIAPTKVEYVEFQMAGC